MPKTPIPTTLIARLEHYRAVATRCGNRTDHPLNVVNLIEQAIQDLTLLSEAALELSEEVQDRDGLSNQTEITLDLANDIRAFHAK